MVFDLITDPEHNLITDITIGQLIGMIATLVIIIGLIRKLGPMGKRINELLDDWFGEKQRPGVPGRKGVMERLSDQDAQLHQVQTKVQPIIDSQAEGNHQEVLRRLDEISGYTSHNQTRLKHVERLLLQHIRESKIWVREVTDLAAEKDFEAPPWPNLPYDDEESST